MLLDYITQFLSSFGSDQMMALVALIIAIGVIKFVAKQMISFVFSVIGLYSAVYFLSPDLAHSIVNFVKSLIPVFF